MTTLNEWRDEAHRIAVEHGFTDASVLEDMALIMTEAAEAIEDFRAGRLPDEVYYEPTQAGQKPCGIPSEMADIIIRVLHFCGKHGINIEQAVEEKMAHNKRRPFKHGGKTK
jgi:NTP pyrophosphatase (non-canonical NTP hydrolase)